MPLFALTIMFSFTFSPKAARRTRNAASRTARSSLSGARRTASASSRETGSPARTASASRCQETVWSMGGSLSGGEERLDVERRGGGAQRRGRHLLQSRQPPEHARAAEGLDQLG